VDHRDKPGDDELFEIYTLFVMAGLVPAIHGGEPPKVPAGQNDTFTRSQASPAGSSIAAATASSAFMPPQSTI
jgi:hypothetical protein